MGPEGSLEPYLGTTSEHEAEEIAFPLTINPACPVGTHAAPPRTHTHSHSPAPPPLTLPPPALTPPRHC